MNRNKPDDLEAMLKAALEICGTRKNMSRRLKLRPATVYAWYRGSIPIGKNVDLLTKLIEKRTKKK